LGIISLNVSAILSIFLFLDANPLNNFRLLFALPIIINLSLLRLPIGANQFSLYIINSLGTISNSQDFNASVVPTHSQTWIIWLAVEPMLFG
jgi:hypothetical protein